MSNREPWIEIAETEVARITQGYRGMPPVTVVATAEQLPVAAPDDARGMYRTSVGDVHIVATNTLITDTLARTLGHEAIGHHAMRAMLGPEFKPFMVAIQAGIQAGDEGLLAVQEYVRRIHSYDGASRLPAWKEADEIAAEVVERYIDPATGRFRPPQPLRARLAHAAGDFWRQGMFFARPASHRELSGKLLAAQHHLEHGGPLYGIVNRAQEWYAAHFTKKWYEHRMRSHDDLKRMLREAQSWEDTKTGWGLLGTAVMILLGVIGAGYIGWRAIMFAANFFQ